MQIFTGISVKNRLGGEAGAAAALGGRVPAVRVRAHCVGLQVEEAEAGKCYVEMILQLSGSGDDSLQE